ELAARGRGLITLHRVVHEVRAAIRSAEVHAVCDPLAGDVVHRGTVAIERDHDHAGEPALAHQTVEVLPHERCLQETGFGTGETDYCTGPQLVALQAGCATAKTVARDHHAVATFTGSGYAWPYHPAIGGGRRGASARIAIMPNTKPPMCAHHAVRV